VAPWITSLADLSDMFVFFGGVLTYLATAAFAVSLGRTQWLGRRVAYAFVAASFFAVLCVVTGGLEFPDPTNMHWVTIPRFIAGIPAFPWIMPCLFGVGLLRRAGNLQR
jgi:hypothetical protein